MADIKAQRDDTNVTKPTLLRRLAGHDGLNYLLTNRIPRRQLTQFAGWLAKVEQPFVRDVSIAVWRRFSDLDLSEAKQTEFKSLHACFIRELKPGARPIDPRTDVLTSPCDAIVGACGEIADGQLMQVKGSTYPLADLLRDEAMAAAYRGGTYVTLRLTASMYHRFHAPAAGRITSVSHIAGDTFNVNPPTLARMDRVYCRNERAVMSLDLDEGDGRLLLVPVAAILVAGLRLHGIELPKERHHTTPWQTACDLAVTKGQELGWFEHGSTIVVIAPPGFVVDAAATTGSTIRMGRPLLHRPAGPRA
jgi:phosphatidylserine decarboxylase